jgi:hypothetical protein
MILAAIFIVAVKGARLGGRCPAAVLGAAHWLDARNDNET